LNYKGGKMEKEKKCPKCGRRNLVYIVDHDPMLGNTIRKMCPFCDLRQNNQSKKEEKEEK